MQKKDRRNNQKMKIPFTTILQSFFSQIKCQKFNIKSNYITSHLGNEKMPMCDATQAHRRIGVPLLT